MPPKAATNAKATPGKSKVTAPKKLELIVTLKVSGSKLAAFNTPTTKSPVSSVGSHTPRKSSPLAAGAVSANDVTASPNAEQQETTPAPSVAASSTGTDLAAGVAPSKPAPKRRAPGGTGGVKPGRKKQRIDGSGINGGGSATSHPKLGPKSNLGAINAHLRALDRSGTPCKKWVKTGFQLKSFTGVQWSLPKWATPALEKSLNLVEASQQTKDSKDEKAIKEEAVKPATPTEAASESKSEVAVPIVVTPPKEEHTDVQMADAERVSASA